MDVSDLPDISALVDMSSLPDLGISGVYFLMEGERVVYVGESCDIRRRIGTHIQEGLKGFDAVRFLCCGKGARKRLEGRFIEVYRPKYNQCWKAKGAGEATEIVPLSVVLKRTRASRKPQPVIV